MGGGGGPVAAKPGGMVSRALRWRSVLVGALAIEAVLVLAHVAVGLPLEVDRLRLDQEQSLPTWFSTTQYAFAALACALVPRRPWAVLSALLLAFSIDDAVSTHEQVGANVGYDLSQEALQPLGALVVGAGLVWLSRRERPPVRGLLVGAAVVLVAGQLLATLGSAAGGSDVLGTAEEWLEMAVGTLLLAAGMAAAERVTEPAPARPRAGRAFRLGP